MKRTGRSCRTTTMTMLQPSGCPINRALFGSLWRDNSPSSLALSPHPIRYSSLCFGHPSGFWSRNVQYYIQPVYRLSRISISFQRAASPLQYVYSLVKNVCLDESPKKAKTNTYKATICTNITATPIPTTSTTTTIQLLYPYSWGTYPGEENKCHTSDP